MRTDSGQAWTTARTVDVLARHYGFSDEHLAALMGTGYSRATIQGRRAGRKAIDMAELELFARAFRVPATVLLMEPADALRWVLDHVPGGGIPDSPARQRNRLEAVAGEQSSELPGPFGRRPAQRGERVRPSYLRPVAS